MDEAEIVEKLRSYTFYHVIRLTDTLETPGVREHVPSQQKTLRALRALDLRGKRVLDIGCRDGLFAFEAERLGASEVVGFDNDLSRAAVEFLVPFFRSQVRLHAFNLLDLRPASFGTFDVVIFSGVLYHLRYPFHGLRLIRDVLNPGAALVLETAVFLDDNRRALLHCPIGAESPYDATSTSFFNLKGLLDTLVSLGLRPGPVESQSSGEVLKAEFSGGASVVPPHWPAAAAPRASELLIDRVALVCTLSAELFKPKLAGYWEGTHDLHSAGKSPD